MKNICLLLSFLCCIISVQGNYITTEVIVNFQPEASVEKQKVELDFWDNKFEKAPNQYTFLFQSAMINEQLFGITGEIQYLKKAESQVKTVLENTSLSRAAYLRSLARIYISQHKFCESLELVQEAVTIGEDLKDSKMMLFDVYLELSEDEMALNLLNQLEDYKDFNYLIRRAKWEDGQGNLDGAISFMKMAKEVAEKYDNRGQKIWVYSNLGDFYGHAAEIELSKEHYLKTLELDYTNWYSVKGLAWIAYSADKNSDLAIELLNHIGKYNESPSINHLKAEIYEYAQLEERKNETMKEFMEEVSKPEYGVMYNKYLCLIKADNESSVEEAINIAKQEVKERPTAESYDLLSWALYKANRVEEAQEIARRFVLDQTSEPEVLLHQYFIFKENTTISDPLYAEVQEASYELGPLTITQL